MKMHGVTPVVAINSFPEDKEADLAAIAEIATEYGALSARCTHYSQGGVGATDLAEAVAQAASEESTFVPLYGDELSLRDKIRTVAQRVYGADDVSFTALANKQLTGYEENGFGRLPVCIAKTHLSISSDPKLLGAPTGWTLPVREVRASVGAGFVYPICGDMRTMPGLGKTPSAHHIDIDSDGNIVGLS
jgi:formate--tetrahydrofolate ligase